MTNASDRKKEITIVQSAQKFMDTEVVEKVVRIRFNLESLKVFTIGLRTL